MACRGNEQSRSGHQNDKRETQRNRDWKKNYVGRRDARVLSSYADQPRRVPGIGGSHVQQRNNYRRPYHRELGHKQAARLCAGHDGGNAEEERR